MEVTIKGKKYTLGVDAFEYEGKNYRASMMFYDNYAKRWIPKGHLDDYHSCIVNYNGDIGFSSKVQTFNNTQYCASLKLEPSWYIEDAMVQKGSNKINKDKRHYFDEKLYSYDEVVNAFETTPEDYEMSPFLQNIAQSIDPELTFGLEYETSAGYILPSILRKLDFYPVYDGSITGHEFISSPIKIAQFGRVEQFCKYLDERTRINALCSFHIHVSGMNLSMKEKVALYTLVTKIQDNLLQVVPPYKSDPKFFANKLTHGEVKDHCAPLPRWVWQQQPIINLTHAYGELFKYFGSFIGVHPNRALDKEYIANLKSEIRCISKWNQKTRYHNFNFINLILLDEDRFEFRLAEPVKTIEDTMFWVLFVQALINYTKKYSEKILINHREKILIEDIFDTIEDELSAKLKDICTYREKRNLESKYINKDNCSNHLSGAEYADLNLDYIKLN